MHKQTILDRIEIVWNGQISLRFAKQIVDRDGTVVSTEPHRAILQPGRDIDAQMATVNSHLVGILNYPGANAREIGRVKALASIAWTNEGREALLRTEFHPRPGEGPGEPSDMAQPACVTTKAKASTPPSASARAGSASITTSCFSASATIADSR